MKYKIKYMYNFDKEGSCAFMVHQIQISYEKEECPLRPPKIIYFCKYRIKWPEIMHI